MSPFGLLNLASSWDHMNEPHDATFLDRHVHERVKLFVFTNYQL